MFFKRILILFCFTLWMTGCSLDRKDSLSESGGDLFSKKLKCVEVADRYVKSQESEFFRFYVQEVHYSKTLSTCLLDVRVTVFKRTGGFQGGRRQVVDALTRKRLASVGSLTDLMSDEAFIDGRATSGVTSLEATAEMDRLLKLE